MDKEYLYPAIERIVHRHFEETGEYISRYEIASQLLEDVKAKQIIKESLEQKGGHPSKRKLWDKSGNYVDWLNADITDRDPLADRWYDGYYARKRSRARHPFSDKTREIWFLAPNKSPNSGLQSDLQLILISEDITETEKLAQVQARVGQGKFREALIQYWKKCAVTGCKEISILRASHIKPWRDSSNQERLDPYNGLLLIPNLDALFDRGLISFNDDGTILISPCLDPKDAEPLGLNASWKIELDEKHKKYINYHRQEKYNP